MSYLEEFQLCAAKNDLAQFFRLWEEYCLADQVDEKELVQVLKLVKNSTIATSFGQICETVLPLWKKLENQESADAVLALILDLQSTNSVFFADLALDLLKRRFSTHKHFNEILRIVGLRSRQNFQGAISNFILINHLEKNNFVFHTGGWGVGEIMDVSLLSEHMSVEFEGISALKDLSFNSAFGNLEPISSDHFLARRFGNPDKLELEGREDPVAIITLLLRDLGPKTAAEIKDELCELVIPQEDWARWWQNARSKVKKCVLIHSPKSAKEPFVARTEALSHESKFLQTIKKAKEGETLLLIYNFTRDFPEILKNSEVTACIREHLEKMVVKGSDLSTYELARQIQVVGLLEDFFPQEHKGMLQSQIKAIKEMENVVHKIEIIAFKKRALAMVRKSCNDWASLFLHLLFTIDQNQLRDYLFRELLKDSASAPLVKEKIKELLHQMTIFPDAFFWYFQKAVSSNDLPYSDQDSRRQFLEAYCILLHFIEGKEEHRELVKKMHLFLRAKRYLLIREIIEGASVDFLNEFLLLASKCYTLSQHDKKILQSLAEVVQPSMKKKVNSEQKEEIIWTTAEGYQKLQEKIQHLGTVEIIENAREIEVARAYGDLRENSEYKFALEKRSRLQGELKTLSGQLNHARILTPSDITTSAVGPGTQVILRSDDSKEEATYTLLGPWEADVSQNILSFQSKFAQAMIGLKVNETFEFQGVKFTVREIRSFFELAQN